MSQALVRLLRQQPTLLQRFRVAVAASGMNLVDLADRAKIHPSVLSRCLRERQQFSADHKARIAAVLGIAEAVLFQDDVREGAA